MSSRSNHTPDARSPGAGYEARRDRLLRKRLPQAMLVAFFLALVQTFSDILRTASSIPRDYWALDVLILVVPLLGAAITSLPYSRISTNTMVLLAELTFTTSIVGFLFVPHNSTSAVTVAISLKLLATAVLLPMPPKIQDRSTVVTLILYFGAIWLTGREFQQTHHIIAPFLAAVLASVGCRRIDQSHRDLGRRTADLEDSESRLRSALQKERLLLSVAQETIGLTDLRSALDGVTRATAEATRATFSTVLLARPEDNSLEVASVHSNDPEDLARIGTRIPGWAGGRLEAAMATGRTQVIHAGSEQDLMPAVVLQGIQSLSLSPIMSHGRLLGVLTAGRRRDESHFQPRELSLLAGIAAQSAAIIRNADLYDNLTTSEAAYRDLFERANDLILVVDDQGAVHFANQAALALFDVDTDGLADIRWTDYLPATEVTRMQRRAAIGRRRSETTAAPFEVQVRAPDGTEATLELGARRISPAGQSPELYQCIARDVTERRRRDQETRALLSRLQESQRLQDEFVANMSHELRTPLNVIIGYADLIADDLAMPVHSDARSFLDRIGAASRALHRMVESILEYARLDRGRMMLIPTHFSTEHLLLELQGLCNDVRSSLDVELSLTQADNVDMATDYDRLYSVLSNLMLNALKFTPKGSVALSVVRDGDDAVFCVRDTGIGIEASELRSVFEPFRQVDGSDTRTFGGVGLGLAIVRRNVDLLQGTIDVDSAPDEGTTFTVRIPIDITGDQHRSAAASTAA